MAVLFTKEVEAAIDVLVKMRTEVGINQENPYLFAAIGNGSFGHLRRCECIRKAVTSNEWKLEHLKLLEIPGLKNMWLLYDKSWTFRRKNLIGLLAI